MKRLREQTVRDAIIQLRQGKSVREVSRSLHISTFSVSKIRQRDKENVPSPKIGRPSKVSKKTKTLLARHFVTGKAVTLRDGQRLIQSVQGVQVHVDSVRNYLKQEGLKAYVQPRKRDLTPDQIRARYEFAKAHLKWTVDDWKNVMFSDETIISRIGSFGRTFYYKKPNRKDIQPHQVQKTKQGGGGKIMVWGCMTFYGLGDACWIPGSMDAQTYLDVLKDYLCASRDWFGMDPAKFIFQQDNAKVHTAGIVEDFLRKSKIAVMEWPANSPDLNPIEHLWSHLKYRLDQYPEAPSSLDDLWERVQDIWTTIDIKFIHELYESMPERMKRLHANKGGHIDY